MIAQIVFDLPIDGPFDYLIPENLASKIVLGSRVKVSFGPRPQIGFVIGVIHESTIAQLKPVLSVCEAVPLFNDLDLKFAQDFAGYYGCSLGEALFTMLRNKEGFKLSVRRERKLEYTLYTCPPNLYADKILEIVKQRDADCSYLILVPDAFRLEIISKQLKALKSVKIGMRSSVFEADAQYECVFMIDDEDSSFKQEQTPMYETRQVLIERSQIYGFDIVFIGVAPSVEIMSMVLEGQVKLIETPDIHQPPARIVDLTNYKFVPGLLSPPVRDALEAAFKLGKKSILVLNRRGSYRLTRCVDCAEILKCSRCDSPLIYSRKEGKFLCRHCTFTAPGDTVCPKCHKHNWKSIGIGVEQVQTEIKKQFPLARIAAFERASASLGDFDILIATNAVLRFQGSFKAQVVAFIDFDAELNRLDMRSAFNAFSLVRHVGSMSEGSLFIQTRNINHYVLQNLSRNNIKGFYDEELKLRQEFGFSPFKHWVKISWRGKLEKLVQDAALESYNVLKQSAPFEYMMTPPLADTVIRKREQFRMNAMVQVNDVPQAISFIKSVQAQLKRRSRVIMTLNIDP